MQREHYFLYKQCLSCSHNEIIHKLVPILFTQGGKFLPLGGKNKFFHGKKLFTHQLVKISQNYFSNEKPSQEYCSRMWFFANNALHRQFSRTLVNIGLNDTKNYATSNINIILKWWNEIQTLKSLPFFPKVSLFFPMSWQKALSCFHKKNTFGHSYKWYEVDWRIFGL